MAALTLQLSTFYKYINKQNRSKTHLVKEIKKKNYVYAMLNVYATSNVNTYF